MINYLPNIHQLKKQVSKGSLYNFALTIFTCFVIAAVVISTLTFLGSWFSYQWELSPDSESILSSKSSESTKILASDGSLLYEMYDKENREIIETMETETNKPVNKNYIPISMQYAILALEDSNFYYNENGVPISNIVGAGITCLSTGGSNCRGASGIYQQLVKNKTLNDEQTIDRKIQEVISSYKMGISEDLTHEQVLSLYLNTVGFGLNAHGVQKAAKVFFKKDIKDITIPQACFLAGLPQIPPNNNSNLEDVNNLEFKYYLDRKDTCLENLADPKKVINPKNTKPFLTKEQLDIYKKEPVVITKELNSKKYSHFVDYVIQEIAYKYLTVKGEEIAPRNLENKKASVLAQYGNLLYDKTLKELKNGGYIINTTINPDQQGMLERSVAKANYAGTNANNGAGVVLDGKTGGIVALVGSRDFNNKEINGQQNQISQFNPYDSNYSSFHTIGSTMKIYDYSMAFDAGANPYAMMNNSPIRFAPFNNLLENFTKNGFGPTVNFSRSLAQSYNVGAAKAAFIGANGLNPSYNKIDQGRKTTEKLREWGEKVGLSFVTDKETMAKDTNASTFAIGTEDVVLLSHATGVNTFAQGGNLRTATPFVSIRYGDRDIYKEKMAMGEKAPYRNIDKVIDIGVANQICKVLSFKDPNTLFRNPPTVGAWDFAGKTGTATRAWVNGKEVVAELAVVSWSKKYTSVLWMGRTTSKAPYWAPLYDNATAEFNLGTLAVKPLMQDLHKDIEAQKFTTEGLIDFRGMLLTDKQRTSIGQLKNVY